MGSPVKKTIVLPIPSAEVVKIEIVQVIVNFEKKCRSLSAVDYYHQLNELAILKIVFEKIRKAIFKADGKGLNVLENRFTV